ncbi:hypothetical protein V1477_005300 [Vespula maculifrons]|uniref:Uncharacterized protein n=1 Tax=Vespula maculifrons TaxID=7453 RepID=A0ABD2CP99_VESMC
MPFNKLKVYFDLRLALGNEMSRRGLRGRLVSGLYFRRWTVDVEVTRESCKPLENIPINGCGPLYGF